MGSVHRLILEEGVQEARRIAAVDRIERLCVDAAYGVLSDEKGNIGIAHAGFAMAALPHKRTDKTVWERESGPIKLLVESGLDENQQPIGIPSGPQARMILLYLQTQAVRTRCREVELGSSMNGWLHVMGIPVGGRTYRAVREQSQRISRCRLTFFRRTASTSLVTNGAFVRDAIFPIEGEDGRQLHLWQERVTLDEGFYKSLIEHPLPLREAAIREICSSSLAIDIYVWLAYRLHVLTAPIEITWGAVHRQFGDSYKEVRKFKRDVIQPLRLALSVYPEAHVNIDLQVGLTLYPSPPPVPDRSAIRRSAL
jgi:Plasmid encoded RepA protein